MSFQILVQVLQILRELTIKLQLKAIDVVSAYKLVDKVVSTLKSMRTNSVSEFKKQFAEAARIAKKLHGDQFELTTPRISGRQRHRSNPPSSTAEEYYRITLYDQFLSHVVSELEERFVNNPSHNMTIGLLHLLPSECIKLGDDVLVPLMRIWLKQLIYSRMTCPMLLFSTPSMTHGCGTGRNAHLQLFLTH